MAKETHTPGTCRKCGCTDTDCRQCIEKTGVPCYWIEPDLCSACVPDRIRSGNKIIRNPKRHPLRGKGLSVLLGRTKRG